MEQKSSTKDAVVKNQNAILKDIINSSWNAIGIIDLDGNFKYVNNAFIPVLGFTQNELLKLNFTSLMLPESKEPFKTLLIDNQKNQYINKLTIGCLRKDTKEVYLEIVINLMHNRKMFVVNAHEVTADVNQAKLIDQFIIQFQIDDKGQILKGSDAFYRLTGYSYNQLVYSDYKEVFHQDDEDNFQSYFESIEMGLYWIGDLTLKKSDGSLLYVNFASQPTYNKYGDIIGHNAVMIDITGEKKLQEHEEFLEKKLIDEEEKLNIMSETIRTVAHEWRQPLNTISLEAQSLAFDLDFEDEINKEDIKQKLDDISKSTEKLSKVIENFQSFTEPKGSKKKRNIKDIVLEALRISELDEKDFVLEKHENSRSFRTYPKELANALSLILINAREFTSIIQNPSIILKTYEENNTIVCEILNNGGNIPEDIKEKIFTPYFSTKKERNGVGLSLYTCKMIVELHLKGTIEVINLDKNYVNFKLTLPIGALEE
jgi:PAS domain S-box-containing protein